MCVDNNTRTRTHTFLHKNCVYVCDGGTAQLLPPFFLGY